MYANITNTAPVVEKCASQDYVVKNARPARKGYDLSLLGKAYREATPSFHAPRGNSKLGDIPAWNLLPVVTCTGEACRTCGKGGCYAVKNALCHGGDMAKNNCLRAWADNTKLVRSDLLAFLEAMDKCLDRQEARAAAGKASKYFRIHASGDFFSQEYAMAWHVLAGLHPGLHFLAFTKAWDAVRPVPFHNLPNFSLVLSAWPGAEVPEDLRALYPVSWVQDGTEDRIPAGAYECPGDCSQCLHCWHPAGRDTYFHKH